MDCVQDHTHTQPRNKTKEVFKKVEKSWSYMKSLTSVNEQFPQTPPCQTVGEPALSQAVSSYLMMQVFFPYNRTGKGVVYLVLEVCWFALTAE